LHLFLHWTIADIPGNKNNHLFISQHFINCMSYTVLNVRISEYYIVNNVEGRGCHLS